MSPPICVERCPSPVKKHYPAITEPKPLGQLLRDIDAYGGNFVVRAALQLQPLIFARPANLSAAEWDEFDLDAAEWRIAADKMNRGVAIFAKAFMGILAQQAVKATRPLMPAAAPAVLLLSLDTQQGVSNIILAMTRRDFGKPAFSLRKKRFVKTHALSLLGTTRLLSRSE